MKYSYLQRYINCLCYILKLLHPLIAHITFCSLSSQMVYLHLCVIIKITVGECNVGYWLILLYHQKFLFAFVSGLKLSDYFYEFLRHAVHCSESFLREFQHFFDCNSSVFMCNVHALLTMNLYYFMIC